jgi:hypothetical protein
MRYSACTRRLHWILLALASTVGLLLAFTTQASAVTYGNLETTPYGDPNASGHPVFYVCNAFVTNLAADGCFEEDGDWLYAQDTATDGEQVATYWRVPSEGRHGLCISNYLAILGVKAWCNKNFPEGREIKIQVGRCNHTSTRHCLKLSDYHDWSSTDTATT